jgi:hypothetical protein
MAAALRIGAVAGGLAGKGAGEVVNPKPDDKLEHHHLGTGVGAGGGALAGAAGRCCRRPDRQAAALRDRRGRRRRGSKGTAKLVTPREEDRYWSVCLPAHALLTTAR